MRKIHAKGVKGFGNELCESTNKQFAMANSTF